MPGLEASLKTSEVQRAVRESLEAEALALVGSPLSDVPETQRRNKIPARPSLGGPWIGRVDITTEARGGLASVHESVDAHALSLRVSLAVDEGTLVSAAIWAREAAESANLSCLELSLVKHASWLLLFTASVLLPVPPLPSVHDAVLHLHGFALSGDVHIQVLQRPLLQKPPDLCLKGRVDFFRLLAVGGAFVPGDC